MPELAAVPSRLRLVGRIHQGLEIGDLNSGEHIMDCDVREMRIA